MRVSKYVLIWAYRRLGTAWNILKLVRRQADDRFTQIGSLKDWKLSTFKLRTICVKKVAITDTCPGHKNATASSLMSFLSPHLGKKSEQIITNQWSNWPGNGPSGLHWRIEDCTDHQVHLIHLGVWHGPNPCGIRGIRGTLWSLRSKGRVVWSYGQQCNTFCSQLTVLTAKERLNDHIAVFCFSRAHRASKM